jgi:hypothetical protein
MPQEPRAALWDDWGARMAATPRLPPIEPSTVTRRLSAHASKPSSSLPLGTTNDKRQNDFRIGRGDSRQVVAGSSDIRVRRRHLSRGDQGLVDANEEPQRSGEQREHHAGAKRRRPAELREQQRRQRCADNAGQIAAGVEHTTS